MKFVRRKDLKNGRRRLLVAMALLGVSACANVLKLDDLTFSGGGTAGKDGLPTAGGHSGEGGQGEPAAAGGQSGDGGGLANGGEGGTSDCSPASALSCADSVACSERPCGGYLWDGGIVPFELDPSLPGPLTELVLNATQAWSESSEAIEFVRCASDVCGTSHERWLQVTYGAPVLEPSAPSGPELLAVDESVTSERIAHELGHVLGLPDLWRRPDRDRYLTFSESAFCNADSHWDLSQCTYGTAQLGEKPTIRPTGYFGPFDASSAMNLSGPEICEEAEPDLLRTLPTAADGSAVTELYQTANAWSPFAPLGRDVAEDLPLEHTLAPDVSLVGSPALASEFYPQLDVFVLGSNHNVYLKNQPFASANELGDWTDWQSLGCCFDSDPAAVSWSSGRTDLFVRSMDGVIAWRTWTRTAGGTWSDWTDIEEPSAGVASAPAVASSGPGRLDVFVRGNNNRLYQRTLDGNWSDWTKVDDLLFVGKPAAASTGKGRMDVVAADDEQTIHHWTYDGTWQRVQLDAPIETESSPALAASAGKLSLYVRARGTHRLYENIFDGATWGEWRDLGGVIDGDPAAIGSSARAHVDVAARVVDHGQPGVWTRSWPYVRPCYAAQEGSCACAEPCAGACASYGPAAGDPTYYQAGATDNWMFRTEDGHLYEVSGIGEYSLTDVSMLNTWSGFAAGEPSGYESGDGYPSVAYRALNGEVHLLSRSGGSWNVANLADSALAPLAAGDPTAYIRADGPDVIDYRGVDQRLYQIVRSGDPWYTRDFVSLVGAPLAASDPRPGLRADEVSAIIYRGTDQHLREIYLTGVSWNIGDLTASASAALSAGEGCLYARSDLLNAVVYRGVDAHIHELTATLNGHTWTAVDLTELAAAPDALNDPEGYVRADGIDAVVYRATDDHLYELRRSGSAWLLTDLTDSALAPDAAGRGIPYVRAGDVSGVAYRSFDGAIHELSLVDDTWSLTTLYQPSP